MARHAYGDEISCGGGHGGCRNLAEWIIRPKWGRPWIVCTLHREAKLQLLRKRWETSNGMYTPTVEPFQDATVPPVRKHKRRRTG